MKLMTKIYFTMVNTFNAHTILGLQKLATEKQIKIAYYTLAKQYHPDSNPGQDTSQQFQRVTRAYELMIKEAAQRSQQSGHKKQTSSKQSSKGDGDSEEKMFKAYQVYKKKHGIKSDSFHKFMDFYQDYTDQKKHPRKEDEAKTYSKAEQDDYEEFDEQFDEEQSSEDRQQSRQHKHRNKKLQIIVDVDLSEEEAKAGTEKRLKIWKKVICLNCQGHPPRRQVKCKKCHGTGVHISKNQIGFCWCCGGSRTVARSECNGCGGKGQTSKQAEEMIHIKPGVANNEELVIKGKGHQHHKRGFFGDLIIKIRINGYGEETQANGIKKVGFNTYETIKISVIQAVLGTKLKYNTVWGQRSMPIRGGVQDGFVIKRNGQGCKKKSHKDNGHHFITIAVEIPMKISQEETQIYEKIREIYKMHKQRSF